MAAHRRKIPGFTLVELLVVIAIIGILVATLLPAVSAAREAARRVQCENKIKQIGVALNNYHSAYLRFPAGTVMTDDKCPPQKWNEREPWTVSILPQMEEQARWKTFDFTKRFVSRYRMRSRNRNAQFTPAPFYQCPSNPKSQPGTVHTDYVGVYRGRRRCGSPMYGRPRCPSSLFRQRGAFPKLRHPRQRHQRRIQQDLYRGRDAMDAHAKRPAGGR